MRLILSVFFIFIFQYCYSQSIEGKWTGKMYIPGSTDTTLLNIEIKQKKKGLSGIVASNFPNGGSIEVSLAVKIDSLSKNVYLKEQTILDKFIPDNQAFFLDEYFLTVKSEKSMTGLVKCIQVVNSKYYRNLSCHDDAIINLVRID